MSEPKLITPLLDDHLLGEPISSRHGVRCCPAIRKDSEEKYMVKIISIPASPRQLDALLLTGAYPTREAALRYFKALADDTQAEAELLQKLSRLEGFIAYDAWQTEPMEDGSGYDVYLLGQYGMTLERHMRRNPMTHLGAVNLGLDLCAALSVCRRNGYLYVDLKPENIVISDSKGYLIGDIGFIALSSLKYASLPDKYRSAYTAPEITDAYSALNTTMDIYALGLVMYQVYNGGLLPQSGEPLVPPVYADYEMAEIILKACHTDPRQRWQDPQQMGQALISYMQRNSVNDVPIIPVSIPVEPPVAEETEAVEKIEEVPADESISMEETEEIPAEESDSMEDSDDISDEATIPVEESVDIPTVEPAPVEEPVEKTEYDPAESSQPEETTDALPEEEPQADELSVTQPPEDESPISDNDEDGFEPEQFVIDGFDFDETAPSDEDLINLPEGILSDEVSAMIAQADELIAHKTPDGVVQPEAIEVPIPEPILPEPEAESGEDTEEEPPAVDPETEEEPALEELLQEQAAEETAMPPVKKTNKKRGCLVSVLIAALLIALIAFGCSYYYQNYYLQNIRSIELSGAEDYLTVTLDTDIDNSLLTVTCTDTYGNKLPQTVSNNQAIFTSLHSGTTYKIAVLISGYHELTGDTTATYTTATQTNIVGFSAITGDTDGSVILNFSVQGPDSTWSVRYVADGETAQTAPCTGHVAMISGLTVGKTYTFHLIPADDLYVAAGDTLEFTAEAVVYAQDLTIHGFDGGILNADWTVPEGLSTVGWTVRCYNNAGYDTTYTVTEPRISIEGLDISQSYTLDVTAQGMTVSRRASISAGSVTFKDILLDNSTADQLVITWNYEGTVPEGGWNLVYTVDGSTPISVNCEKNTCTLEYLIPGAVYSFSFDFQPGTSVFGGTAEFTSAAAEAFAGYEVSLDYMLVSLCLTPENSDWTWKDVAEEDYTTEFAVGESASAIVRLTQEYVTSPDNIEVLFVIRDSNGSVINSEVLNQTWTSLWYKGYCELDLPALPTVPGTYTAEIYFNGAYITIEPIAFTVV